MSVLSAPQAGNSKNKALAGLQLGAGVFDIQLCSFGLEPFYLESSKPWIQGFVPVVRQLKLIRKFQKLQLLLHVLATTMDALKLLLFLVCLIVLVFGCAFYVLEPETMDSLSTSIYLCTVTVTTVGTCDMNPVSPVGKMMAGALCLTSVSRRKVEGLLSLGIIADGDMTHVLRWSMLILRFYLWPCHCLCWATQCRRLGLIGIASSW